MYKGKHFKVHRLSWLLAGNELLPGMHIDHRCHNHACYNVEHLRQVTPKQNLENLSGPPRTNTSGYLGVSWSKQAGKWRVRCKHLGREYHGGTYDDLDEAGEASRLLRNRLYTHNDVDRRVA